MSEQPPRWLYALAGLGLGALIGASIIGLLVLAAMALGGWR